MILYAYVYYIFVYHIIPQSHAFSMRFVVTHDVERKEKKHTQTHMHGDTHTHRG